MSVYTFTLIGLTQAIPSYMSEADVCADEISLFSQDRMSQLGFEYMTHSDCSAAGV